jgi:sn-glycerol 3-phosphate transport system substrate-binding protein
MFITSTSDVFEVSKKASFRVMTAPLPKKTADAPGGTVIGGNSLWILKAKPADEQKASYAFLKFMASKPVQRKWHMNTGYFPIRADVIADLEKEGFYASHPAVKTAVDQIRATPDTPATRGALMGVFSEARIHVESAIEKVLAGQDAKTVLARAKVQTDEALARYNRGRERLEQQQQKSIVNESAQAKNAIRR